METSRMLPSKIQHYQIGQKVIEYDRACKLISVKWYEGEEIVRVNIPLTPTELIVIKSLLDTTYRKESDLEHVISMCSSEKKHKAEKNITKKHIVNLRSKLHSANLHIFRIQRYGYILDDICASPF
jgi:DNA-binding response OmpR family regulator